VASNRFASALNDYAGAISEAIGVPLQPPSFARETIKAVQPAVAPPSRESDLNSLSVFTAIVVLATVTMTFGAMIAVFIVRSQAPVYWGRLVLPNILWASTAILLTSSYTLESARRHLFHNDQPEGFHMLCWTTACGFAFLGCQVAAWLQVLHSGLILNRNPHSWFIFLFTGLHGLHIFLGLAGLIYLLVRTRVPVSGPKYLMKTRVVATGVGIFWHYLDFLWIVLFGLLLIWRR
jgi:cytochrome c oxidase subunit 3